MAIGDKLQQGMQSTIGGMSQAVDPALLQDHQYAMGLNVSSRRGLPHTRPVFKELGAVIPDGKFQGAFTYKLNEDHRIIFGVAGSVYSLKLSSLTVTKIADSALSSTADHLYFVQADRYCIVQDGEPSSSWANANWPVIIHEDSLIDQSAISDEERCPKGAMMAYAHGRLFVAVNYVYTAGVGWSSNLGRSGWVAGDIIKAYDPESVLSFTENTYLNEGGRIVMPAELGYIMGMGSQKNIVNSMGQGPLVVLGENGVAAYQVNAPRDQWKDIDFGITMFSGVGMTSPHSLVNHNADLFYRANDGIRSLADTSSKSGGGQGLSNDSISEEAVDILSLDDRSTRLLTEMAIANDRLFCVVVPDSNNTFRGLLSMDMSPVKAISGSTPPIYDGVWTGLSVASIASAQIADVEYLIIFAKKSSTETSVLYLDESGYVDAISDSPVVRIYTGQKVFESPFDIKKLKYVEVWLGDVIGSVILTGYWRFDDYEYWSKMTSVTLQSDSSGPGQRRKCVRLTKLDDVDNDPITNDSLDTGFAVQFCIEMTGHATIRMARFVTEDTGVQDFNIAGDSSAEELEEGDNTIELNDYEYEVTLS